MNNEEAKRIVSDYFKILEKNPEILDQNYRPPFAAPLSLLANSKDEIKTAIKIGLITMKSAGQLDEKTKIYLRIGYFQLATFTGDEEAKIVNNFDRKLRKVAEAKGELVPELNTERYPDILDSMNKERAELFEEIKNFSIANKLDD